MSSQCESHDVSSAGGDRREEAHQGHQAYRDSVMRKVDHFLDLDFDEYLQGVQKQVTLESMRGAKPYVKNEVFVAKLLNGCDAAGG